MTILIRGPRRRAAVVQPNSGPSLREVCLLGEPAATSRREGDTLRRAGRAYRVTAAQAGYVHLAAVATDNDAPRA